MRLTSLRTAATVAVATAAVASVSFALRESWLPEATVTSPAGKPAQAWRTYRNVAHGFTLQYPPSWAVTESTNDPAFVAGFAATSTPRAIASDRLRAAYPYDLSIQAYPSLADHPLAKTRGLAVATVAEFFAQVPTVAAMGETTVGGVLAYEFITNEGHQFYGLLVPKGGRVYVLSFERTWTKARFDATTTERAVLQSFQWTAMPADSQ